MAKSIKEQLDAIANKIYEAYPIHIITKLDAFGMHIVTNVIPNQEGFRNLTGNTTHSYAYGVYYNGLLQLIGFDNSTQPPIRGKVVAGEMLFDFEDYDGNLRKYFIGNRDTDGGDGRESAIDFLMSYQPSKQYEIVFTTGTEYSAYLENELNLNVLTEAKESSIGLFLNSFKPISKL